MVALHTRIKFLVIFYIVLGGSIDRSNGDTPADTDQDIEDNLLWIGSSSSACETPSVQDVPIAGYLPDYRFFGDLNLTTTMPLLDDLIVFSIEVSADGSTGGCCLGNDHYKAISEAKFHQQNPSRTWIAIGGAGRNQQWPMMASNEKSRKRFLESVEQLWYVQIFAVVKIGDILLTKMHSRDKAKRKAFKGLTWIYTLV